MFSKVIFCRVQTGKPSPSTAKIELMEREVAFLIGVLTQRFRDKILDEERVCNSDETPFSINLGEGHMLSMQGDTEVKYRNIFSGNVGMLIMVILGSGSQPRFEIPITIFKTKGSPK